MMMPTHLPASIPSIDRFIVSKGALRYLDKNLRRYLIASSKLLRLESGGESVKLVPNQVLMNVAGKVLITRGNQESKVVQSGSIVDVSELEFFESKERISSLNKEIKSGCSNSHKGESREPAGRSRKNSAEPDSELPQQWTLTPIGQSHFIELDPIKYRQLMHAAIYHTAFPIVEMLKTHTPAFRSIPLPTMLYLASYFELKHYSNGDSVYQIGSLKHTLGLVLSGTLSSTLSPTLDALTLLDHTTPLSPGSWYGTASLSNFTILRGHILHLDPASNVFSRSNLFAMEECTVLMADLSHRKYMMEGVWAAVDKAVGKVRDFDQRVLDGVVQGGWKGRE